MCISLLYLYLYFFLHVVLKIITANSGGEVDKLAMIWNELESKELAI
jgi:hypothetical protein